MLETVDSIKVALAHSARGHFLFQHYAGVKPADFP